MKFDQAQGPVLMTQLQRNNCKAFFSNSRDSNSRSEIVSVKGFSRSDGEETRRTCALVALWTKIDVWINPFLERNVRADYIVACALFTGDFQRLKNENLHSIEKISICREVLHEGTSISLFLSLSSACVHACVRAFVCERENL